MIYLDHNATTPVLPAAAEAMAEVLARVGNPSSVHGFGREARRVVEDARERIAALAGADPAQVILTGGGSEANNLGLRGADRRRVLVSAVEHPSILNARPESEPIPVGADGVVDLQALEVLLGEDDTPAVVAVMLANNETGVIQPVAAAAEIAHRFGALVHCDAVQAAAKVPVEFGALGVDLLALSAHKMGGPQGVGALVAGDDVSLDAQIRGGGQERRRRGGTENVAGITGFGVAAEHAEESLADGERLGRLRDGLEDRIQTLVPGAEVLGAGAERLPNTSCVAMPGVASETQVMALDLAGVAVSAGSACSSGKVETSHVLAAMGVAENVAAAAIRVSLGWTTTEDDIDGFVAAWGDLHDRISGESASAAA